MAASNGDDNFASNNDATSNRADSVESESTTNLRSESGLGTVGDNSANKDWASMTGSQLGGESSDKDFAKAGQNDQVNFANYGDIYNSGSGKAGTDGATPPAGTDGAALPAGADRTSTPATNAAAEGAPNTARNTDAAALQNSGEQTSAHVSDGAARGLTPGGDATSAHINSAPEQQRAGVDGNVERGNGSSSDMNAAQMKAASDQQNMAMMNAGADQTISAGADQNAAQAHAASDQQRMATNAGNVDQQAAQPGDQNRTNAEEKGMLGRMGDWAKSWWNGDSGDTNVGGGKGAESSPEFQNPTDAQLANEPLKNLDKMIDSNQQNLVDRIGAIGDDMPKLGFHGPSEYSQGKIDSFYGKNDPSANESIYAAVRKGDAPSTPEGQAADLAAQIHKADSYRQRHGMDQMDVFDVGSVSKYDMFNKSSDPANTMSAHPEALGQSRTSDEVRTNLSNMQHLGTVGDAAQKQISPNTPDYNDRTKRLEALRYQQIMDKTLSMVEKRNLL